MLFRKRTSPGICFAWTPKRTPDGLVWLEWVHYEHDEHGLVGVSYTRWVPEAEYEAGKRREINMQRLRCRSRACWYPHCSRMRVGGTKCPG